VTTWSDFDVNDSLPLSKAGAALPTGHAFLSWMRLLPTGIALLTALVLFAAQQFYFEIDDAHDNAVGQAEALLDLARATRAWSDGEIHGVMSDAVGHFEHVVSASYCHSVHWVHIETVESGEDCTAGKRSNW
jgi:hypothetical protein